MNFRENIKNVRSRNRKGAYLPQAQRGTEEPGKRAGIVTDMAAIYIIRRAVQITLWAICRVSPWLSLHLRGS